MPDEKLFDAFDLSSTDVNDLREIIPESLLAALDALIARDQPFLVRVGLAEDFIFSLHCGAKDFVLQVSKVNGLTLAEAKAVEARYVTGDVVGWPRAKKGQPKADALLAGNRDNKKNWWDGF
ncbi:MAG TPA: hypothetical protein VFZ48_02525 [Candidatus Saccharimonadales bacterium]